LRGGRDGPLPVHCAVQQRRHAWSGRERGEFAAGGGAEDGRRHQTFDFAFGSDDVYTLLELPDNTAAAALAMAVNAAGQATVRTVPLVTPEEVDEAASRTVEYLPPVH
jgi:uncharacterized protein with GYD domain